VDIDEVMRKFDLLERKIEYLIEQCSTLKRIIRAQTNGERS
jgi:hypothetical protein